MNQLQKIVGYLRHRITERSSQIQFGILVIYGLVATGVISVEQLQAAITNYGTIGVLVGPVLGILMPDNCAKQASLEAPVEAPARAPEVVS